MRTTVDIDDRLLDEVRKRAHLRTKKETVDQGLRELLNAVRRRELIERAGKGFGITLRELDRMRRDE